MKCFAILSLIATTSLLAQNGQTLYNTYCSGCHAPDGKGVSNGQFPALAGSEWVKGTPERIIQIVLRGLQGPIKVAGKDYNLVMPPQGAALTDSQIADIITYVRSAWGHKESAVTVKQVMAQRASSKNQVMMWDSDKLLKLHPIPGYTVEDEKPPRGINDLLSYIHHGAFKSLEDLRASEAKNAEEENSGLISLGHADRKDKFGLVWEGWLEVPYDGNYTFTYDTDDGGAVTVNGKEIITRNRIGGAGKATRGSIDLKKGRTDIKIEYFEFSGDETVSLFWDGPGVRKERLSETKGKGSNKASLPLVPPINEAIIYRNFIAGTDPRAIGVGYFENVNLSFSADSMSLDLLWTGKFMDAGRHWTGRGQGFEAPAGDQVITVNRGIPFAFLESQTAKWNSSPLPELNPRFRGYKLDKKQQPTFMYEFGSLKFTDEILPVSQGKQFVRTIHIEIPETAKTDKTLYFRALSGGPVTSRGKREFAFKDNFTVAVPESAHPPFQRNSELLIPIPMDEGNQTLKLIYTWK